MNVRKQFRIIYLRIDDCMFKESEIYFDDRIRDIDNNYLSIMIGNNGVGKTRLLRDIASIFLEISNKKEKVYSSYRSEIKSYFIKYLIDGNIYCIEKKGTIIKLYRNENSIGLEQLELPQKVLVNSFMIGDKFTYRSIENNAMYKYLGVRETNARTSTTAVEKKIAESIIKGIEKERFMYAMNEVMIFLGLKNKINLSYKTKLRKEVFLGHLEVNKFREIMNEKLIRRTKTDPFWKKKWENIEYDEEIEKLVYFINVFSRRIDSKGCINYNIKFDSSYCNTEIIEEVMYLNKLIELDLIKAPTVKVFAEEMYGLSESSSGELHILFLMTSILSELENNSLILMDEPEISLHPSWIIKFTELINRMLSKYEGCHAIIATHSHFILSDLNEKNSNIIILKRENGRVKIESSASYTYGWSAENILYKVFGVPSCRNYYLTSEVQKVLDVITRNERVDISKELNMLRELEPNLSSSDPLRVVIEELLKRTGDKHESL